MDVITCRSYYGRIPGFAALLALAILSFLFISSPVQGDHALNRFHHREAGSLAWRREDLPAPPQSNATGSSSSLSSSTSIPINATQSSSTRFTSMSTSHATSTQVSTVSSSRAVTRPSTSAIPPRTTSISTAESSSARSLSTSSSLSRPVATLRAGAPSTSVPRSTLIVPAAIAPTSTTTQISTQSNPAPTMEAVKASSRGFWENKGAVAATFVIISLLIFGIVAVLLLNFFKKRTAARQRRLHAELFNKYSDTVSPNNSVRRSQNADVVYDDSHFQGATVTSSYPFAGSGFAVASSSQDGPQEQYPDPPQSSGAQAPHNTVFYTPSDSQQSLSTQQPHNASSIPALQQTHYILPSQGQAAQNSNDGHSAPPVAYRGPHNPRGSYQPSIDSFYGYYSANNAGGP